MDKQDNMCIEDVILPRTLMQRRDLTISAKLLWAYWAAKQVADRLASPGIERTAQALHCCPQTVRNARKQLLRAGLLREKPAYVAIDPDHPGQVWQGPPEGWDDEDGDNE